MPTTFTLYYTSSVCLALLPAVGLEPHPDGPVEMVQLFAISSLLPKEYCVHPLLIYADLVTASDAASRRVATQMLSTYLPHLAG